tara:strand:- start:167 stop:574 length:408 start_codon:yes stop_codon:yes gene_type:complete
MKISKEEEEWLRTGNFGENDPGPIKTAETTKSTVLRESETHAPTPEVKKEEVPKWRQKLKEIDGQGKDGKGKGGRLAGAAKVIDQFQGYRDAAKWRPEMNTTASIRKGLSKTELAQGDEIGNYDAWLKRTKKEKF